MNLNQPLSPHGNNTPKHVRVVRLGRRKVFSYELPYNFLTDLHHLSMTASWLKLFLGMGLAFLLFNTIFALLYALPGTAIANARASHPLDYFFFSVETFATVGYGVMYPQTFYGHAISTLEILLSLCSVAVMTGLIFSRFSRPKARLIFAQFAVIGQHEGRTMLMIRLANARHNAIADAQAKLWITRTEKTLEGTSQRRFYRLKLERNENPIFVLSWTIFHCVDESSPLHDLTADDLARMDLSLIVTIKGLDENMAQEVNDRHIYSYDDIRINYRYVDIMEHLPEGTIVHYDKFHTIEAEA